MAMIEMLISSYTGKKYLPAKL